MPPFVRRKPWHKRLEAWLNPLDFWLWLSEEIETRDYDEEALANYLGAGLNFLFLILRANTGGISKSQDDVFGDASSGTGWLRWFASAAVYFLTAFSITNASWTFMKKRSYRLFESSVDVKPSTPSAHRVRVDSSPASSSPLRFLTSIIGETTADSRSHPDPTRDVWELAVWDPLPLCLRLYCLFSPGHVLVYWLFLPIAASNPQPSITVFTTIVLQVLLSVQLLFLQLSFAQQQKDTALVQKEVLNEYDTKFVHPRLTGEPVRDVGTQFNSSVPHSGVQVDNEVETYTPVTIVKRTFKTNPNPNYAKYVSPDNPSLVPTREAFSPLSAFQTPGQTYSRRESTPLRTAVNNIRQPNFRQSTGGAVTTGSSVGNQAGTSDGGSLGVYTHANSPLKKATSMYDMDKVRHSAPMNSLQAAAREIAEGMERDQRRATSPAKRAQEEARRRTSVPPRFSAEPKDMAKSRGPSYY